MATQQQSNSSEQLTEIFSDSKCNKTKDKNWVDTISDWNEVLAVPSSGDAVSDGDRSVSPTKNGQPSPDRNTQDDVDENGSSVSTVPLTRYDLPADVDTLVQVEPVSDELLGVTIETLPSGWLTDTETQTVIQQLVYRFIEHTSHTDSTPNRFQSVCDEMDCESFAHLCTTPLYDDRPDMWTEYFEGDLETIEKRVRSGTTVN